MTDIMKLATAYATSAQVDGRHDFDSSKTDQARAALQAAIDALQAECAEHKENAIRNARQAVAFRAERDALAAKLDELQRQEPIIDFTVLHQFASDQAISYNKLCTAVRMCLAAPKALEPDALTPDERQQVLELLDKEGHDGKDFEPECPLCTARQKLSNGITKGTP